MKPLNEMEELEKRLADALLTCRENKAYELLEQGDYTKALEMRMQHKIANGDLAIRIAEAALKNNDYTNAITATQDFNLGFLDEVVLKEAWKPYIETLKEKKDEEGLIGMTKALKDYGKRDSPKPYHEVGKKT